MYVRGEVHGNSEDLRETIDGVRNLAIGMESWREVGGTDNPGCLYSAINYLCDLLEAIDYEDLEV